MYSVEQLSDALKHIDKEKFPDRVEVINHYLKNPGPRGNTSRDKTIVIGKKTQVVLGLLSMEVAFWLVLAALSFIAYVIC